jgi:hypothetical protein
MITTFYLFLIIFALNEIYYVFNKPRLDLNMKNRDVENTRKIDLVHYLLRALFWCWMVIGLWSSQSEMFIFLGSLHLIRFPFYHISRKLYIIWNNILPAISIIFIMIILIYKLKG